MKIKQIVIPRPWHLTTWPTVSMFSENPSRGREQLLGDPCIGPAWKGNNAHACPVANGLVPLPPIPVLQGSTRPILRKQTQLFYYSLQHL